MEIESKRGRRNDRQWGIGDGDRGKERKEERQAVGHRRLWTELDNKAGSMNGSIHPWVELN